jgi:short-subunit dehydrogenase
MLISQSEMATLAAVGGRKALGPVMRELRQKVAIVTGASGGIGLHVARALAAEGMHVVLAARSADRLAGAAADLSTFGPRAVPIPTDVNHPPDLERLVTRTVAEFGRLDVLVNNAGVETYCPFERLPLEDIARTITTNLTAAITLTRLAAGHLLADGGGHVVNMSSTAGKAGPAFGTAYGASKAGLIAFTESLRAEYAGRGLSASVICPGFTHDGGIYERMKRATGKGTPPLMGSTTADAVAGSVVRAIRDDRPELIVNTPPMRPVFALKEMFPALGGWIIRRASQRFLQRIATKRGPAEATADAVRAA